MDTIVLKPLYHRSQECMGIYFPLNGLIQSIIQKQVGGKWSKTHSCWYIACTGENYLRLKTALENKAELEIGELKKFLIEKRKANAELPLSNNNHKIIVRIEKKENVIKVATSKNRQPPKIN